MTQQNPFAGNQQRPPVDEFELMRRRLQQRGSVRKEEIQRESARQAAALGNLPSGAAMKQRQIATQEAERLTGEQVQDVNIAEAQIRRQERESALERGLKRFGITTQKDISTQEIAGRKELSAQEIIGRQDLQTLQGRQQLAQIGASGEQQRLLARVQGANDMELAKLNNASAAQIANLQIKSQEKLVKLQESGLDSRFAQTLSQNQKFFDLEQGLREKGFNLQEEVFANTKNQQEQQMKMDKFATVVNSIDLLKSFGIQPDQLSNILDNIGLDGLSDDVKKALMEADEGLIQREATRRAQQI